MFCFRIANCPNISEVSIQTSRMMPMFELPKSQLQGFFQVNIGVSLNGWYPQIIHFNRVFHINHPFWGTTIFGNTHIWIFLLDFCFPFYRCLQFPTSIPISDFVSPEASDAFRFAFARLESSKEALETMLTQEKLREGWWRHPLNQLVEKKKALRIARIVGKMCFHIKSMRIWNPAKRSVT